MEGTCGELGWKGHTREWHGGDMWGVGRDTEEWHGGDTWQWSGMEGTCVGWDGEDTGRVGIEGTQEGLEWREHTRGTLVSPLVPIAPSPSSSRPVSDMELSSEALSSVGQGPVRTELGPPAGAKALPRPRHHPARPCGPPLPSPTPPVPTCSRMAAIPARPALPSHVQFPACPGWAGWGYQQGRSRLRCCSPGPWRGQGQRECGHPWMAATGMGTRQLGHILPPFGCRC